MPASEHDAVLARTSHLPHLLSCVLSAVTGRELFPFTGTGYASMTRLSGGNPEVWRDILTDNRKNVLAAMERFERQFDEIREILSRNDAKALEEFLTLAREQHDAQ